MREKLTETTAKTRPMRAPRTKGIPLGRGLAWNSMKTLSTIVTAMAEMAEIKGAPMQNQIGKDTAARSTSEGTDTWEETQMAKASDPRSTPKKEPRAAGVATRGRDRPLDLVTVGVGEAILSTGILERRRETEALIRWESQLIIKKMTLRKIKMNSMKPSRSIH